LRLFARESDCTCKRAAFLSWHLPLLLIFLCSLRLAYDCTSVICFLIAFDCSPCGRSW
jgi:hypothetical protein